MHPVTLYSPISLSSVLKEKNTMVVQITDTATYLNGHIPNALLVTPEEIMNDQGPMVGKLPSIANIRALLSKIGYRTDHTIVVYDNEGGACAWKNRIGRRRSSTTDNIPAKTARCGLDY